MIVQKVLPVGYKATIRRLQLCTIKRHAHYMQGQSPNQKTREYFYYIDHQGQLFMDDARMKNFTSCFKEKAFLKFFFSRLKCNEGHRYTEFPYISPCGREQNYIRCDDLPIVFTHIFEKNREDMLSYGSAGDALAIPFDPAELCMLPATGRVYHCGLSHLGGVGLIKSNLAVELSKHFTFQSATCAQPTHFTWKGVRYELTNSVIPLLGVERKRRTDLARE